MSPEGGAGGAGAGRAAAVGGGGEGVPPITDETFAEEAAVFVRVMADVAPGVRLDGSPGSLADLDAALTASFGWAGAPPAPESLMLGVGCYMGEVIRRHLGGSWNDEGHLEGAGVAVEAFPLQRARRRLEDPEAGSLAAYFAQLAGR